jgi:hypothetical protein
VISSRPDHFIPGTQIGGCVRPRGDEEKNAVPAGDRTPDPTDSTLIITLTELPRFFKIEVLYACILHEYFYMLYAISKTYLMCGVTH